MRARWKGPGCPLHVPVGVVQKALAAFKSVELGIFALISKPARFPTTTFTFVRFPQAPSDSPWPLPADSAFGAIS